MSRVKAYRLKNGMIVLPIENQLGLAVGTVIHTKANVHKPHSWDMGDAIIFVGPSDDPIQWKGGNLGKKYDVIAVVGISPENAERFM